MELRHLRYFVMAAEEANISRAAARLNVSQPAVSRQIRDLEDELGVTLFERQHNGLKLTEAGEITLGYARDTLRSALILQEAAQRIAANEEARIVRIGYLPTALSGFLADGLRRFRETRKNVVVQLHEMTPTAQEKALCQGTIDIALLGRATSRQKKEYRVVPIQKTPLAIALPDDHSLAMRKSIDLAELGGEPFVTLDDSLFPGRKELMREMWEKAGMEPSSTIVATGLSELLGLVGSGTGAAVVPADLAELPHPRVVFVPLRHPRKTLTFSAATRKDDHLAGEIVDLLADPESGTLD